MLAFPVHAASISYLHFSHWYIYSLPFLYKLLKAYYMPSIFPSEYIKHKLMRYAEP